VKVRRHVLAQEIVENGAVGFFKGGGGVLDQLERAEEDVTLFGLDDVLVDKLRNESREKELSSSVSTFFAGTLVSTGGIFSKARGTATAGENVRPEEGVVLPPTAMPYSKGLR
jgi:hypothetical protein